MTDRDSVRRALEEVTLAYGGVDHVVVDYDPLAAVVDVPVVASGGCGTRL